MGKTTVAVTDAEFESSVLKSDSPVLVDFWAEWCGPCRALGPKLEEIASEMGEKVTIAKVNVDENPKSPSEYGVRGIPMMVLFKNGEVVEELVGNLPKDQIVTMLEKHV